MSCGFALFSMCGGEGGFVRTGIKEGRDRGLCVKQKSVCFSQVSLGWHSAAFCIVYQHLAGLLSKINCTIDQLFCIISIVYSFWSHQYLCINQFDSHKRGNVLERRGQPSCHFHNKTNSQLHSSLSSHPPSHPLT
jgi:hypothetical protein